MRTTAPRPQATTKNPTRPSATAFLEGGGELGALMRAYDWTTTPLGSPELWPESLKTAVRIMLTSRQPFWIGYGPELTYLYNDPYKSIIGGKHPRALGRPFSEVWREIYHIIGPMADHVINHDEGTYVESQRLIMHRHGYEEETYYTFSYSPIPGEDGRPGGLICANTDDTRRVIGERQIATLAELAARTAHARSRAEACRLAAVALGTNARDLPFVVIRVDGTPVATSGIDPERAPAEHRVTELTVVSLEDHPHQLPSGDWERAPSQAVVVPIAASGQAAGAGMLIVGLNPFRKLDESYGGFLQMVAAQISSAIANAEAYEEERKRSEVLAELDRAKTNFFSNVSHEFRTPLTLMLGPVEDMLAAGDEVTTDRAALEVVHRNGQRLLKLVNTLLDFARIEAGRAHTNYEPIDLAAFTAALASNFRSACERAGLRLDVDCPPLSEAAWVDREMWEKIVLNLLSNAFKFTLEGEIAVTLRETADQFELSIRDTGAGIPAAELPRMFERFHRIEGTRGRSHEGSGIGLALVQELVGLHGGSIAVSSELGAGSTFTVRIPRGRNHLARERLRPEGRGATPSARAEAYVDEALSWLPGTDESAFQVQRHGLARVLLVDDNADLREYARKLLAEHYDVEVSADGEMALAAARARKPDVIVTDVMMPGLDGFGLIRELRNDPELLTVPVIILSARAGEEARMEGLERGADDYLVKPFSARELLVRVGSMLNSANIRHQAEQAIRESETRLRLFITNAPAGIAMFDRDMRYITASRRWMSDYGLTGDLIGRSHYEVIPDLKNEWREVHRRALAGESLSSEADRFERADGTVLWRKWEVQPWRDAAGEIGGILIAAEDITARRNAEEAVREADRHKDEFLATLSHELRNPLAPLSSSLHLLRHVQSDAKARTIQEIMQRQVDHLVRLVDDLMEVSRITRGSFELRREEIVLQQVIRNAIETSQPLIDGDEHRLEVSLPDEPLLLEADPVRLAQVFSNLLNNSARYTPPGGRISIEARDEGSEVVVRVSDNGEGIEADLLPRIFDMFSRGNRTSRPGQTGLGIGLALVSRLVGMHGGTVDAESRGPGEGSRFTVRLPASGARRPREQPRGQPGRIERRRVLVVDDNRDALESLGMLLELLGAEVSVAHDGATALSVFDEYRPDLVLLDIGMPGMDGYEVARALRKRDNGMGVELVALTGWGQEEDRTRAQEAGFDRHLIKPANMDTLRSLLATRPESARSATS